MKYDLLSLGSAVVDKIICVDDAFLEKMKFSKGSTRNIVNIPHEHIIKESGSKNVMYAPGGSAANTTKIVAGLGKKCAYIAKVGADSWGEYYKKSCIDRNLTPLFRVCDQFPSGSVLCLITPDGERTMCTDLRACQAISGSDILPEYFDEVSFFHVDGYNFYYEDAMRNALKIASERKIPTTLDFCSYELVRSHHQTIMNYVEQKTFHLLFANEREAFQATGLSDPVDACLALSKHCHIATVMMGEKGSVSAHNGKTYLKLINPIKAIDTTGAGDMFVGGFLFGYLSKLSIEECMSIGTITAAEGIQVFGGELPMKNLQRLKEKLTEMKLIKN